MAPTGVTADWLACVHSMAGEQTDLERALARHGGALYRYFVVRSDGDGHQADDLMQQLWLAASKEAASVPAEQIEFWLRAVAKNLVLEHWRKQRARRRRVPMADAELAAELADRMGTEELPEECWQRQEVRDQLALAITELSTAEQEVIVAYYFQDESQADLAARLGISERAVEGRLYRARGALRQKLRKLDV